MKTFVVSLISFFIILSSVTVYIVLLNNSVNKFAAEITGIVEAAKKENWDECERLSSNFKDKWGKSKKWYEAFIDHREIDLINEAALKMSNSVAYHDTENVVSEGNMLIMLLGHLYRNELPVLENILQVKTFTEDIKKS